MLKRFGLASILYAGLVVALTWPAILKLQNSVIGGGDAFQFIWGMWWVDAVIKGLFHSLWNCPLILVPYGADLVQHDLALWPGFLASISQRMGLTLVGSYNTSILLAFWLNACAAFLLADNVIKTDRDREQNTAEPSILPAFVGGLVFAFAPYFCGRSAGHFGLMHAYALPLAALCLFKIHETNSARWCLGTGLCFVLAVFCQYYYAVYIASSIAVFYLVRTLRIQIAASTRPAYSSSWVTFLLSLGTFFLIAATGTLIFISEKGKGIYKVMGIKLSLHDTANPMIAWWLSWAVAFLLRYRLNIKIERRAGFAWRQMLIQWSWMALPMVALIPLFIQAGHLIVAGDFGTQQIGWKTGPQGAYPLTALFPNVYHSLWGLARFGKLSSWKFGEEGSIGLGWTALSVVLLTKSWKNSPGWTLAFLSFFVMSWGPFLKIVPGLDFGPVLPFWFFRYIPVFSGARIPIRWIAPALALWAVLVAKALQSLHSRALRMACLIGVIVESLMISPHFSSIEIPAVYRMLSADKSAGALLELPLGVRDGRKFWGEEFPAEILYYQTVHHHPIVGGYLSRVPDRIFSEYAKQPFLQQLILWQNNLPGNQVIEGNSFAAWAKDWKLSWILLDKNRAKGMLSDKISHLLGKPSYEDGSTIAWKIGDAG